MSWVFEKNCFRVWFSVSEHNCHRKVQNLDFWPFFRILGHCETPDSEIAPRAQSSATCVAAEIPCIQDLPHVSRDGSVAGTSAPDSASQSHTHSNIQVDFSASGMTCNKDNAIETEDKSTYIDLPVVIEYSAPAATSVLELSSSNQVDPGIGMIAS